jgi:hypothetical protein
MNRKLLVSSLIFVLGFSVFAQVRIPVIKATSGKVDIRDGNDYTENAWRIMPDIRPDIYITSSKKVTFYTDMDSISFEVKPNRNYNFVILLNNKDSAFTQIRYLPTHLEILKTAGKYDYTDNRSILEYRYPSANDPNLVTLREIFNLDSIAGTADEISRILNLLHWVHYTFQYDGTKETPEHDGIADLMIKCLENHQTMHCGALASVLNNCYLAVGLKSRQVVCLPKDSTDMDCHSINTVFSITLNKWIWIDPTNNAYIMDEKGGLLSIAEVRERLIKKKPLILNPDANVNRLFHVVKEYYLYEYMAKNLYAFQCYAEQEGDNYSNLLLPLDYKGVIPRTRMNHPKCTHNPDIFWSKPQ